MRLASTAESFLIEFRWLFDGAACGIIYPGPQSARFLITFISDWLRQSQLKCVLERVLSSPRDAAGLTAIELAARQGAKLSLRLLRLR